MDLYHPQPKRSTSSGVAHIKAEFIIKKDEKPQMIKKDDAGQALDETNPENKDQESQTKEDRMPQPKRRKGQNKSRPRTVPKEDRMNKLCPHIIQEELCPYGEDCCYSHDIEAHAKNRLPDLGEKCINFELTGKCLFGIECRYGSQHLSLDKLKNIIDDVKYKQYLDKGPPVKNALSKETLQLLRKRKYLFPKSDEAMKCLQKKKSQNTPQIDKAAIDTPIGALTDEDLIKLRKAEVKKLDVANKTYLAPLTTLGNLPFRRVCKKFGADITCGEMAMAVNLLQGQKGEWALLKRHKSEDLFGVQICGSFPDTMSRCAEMLCNETKVDFIDVNVGCPIDLIYRKGAGSALMGRVNKFQEIVETMVEVADIPITVKIRTGIHQKSWNAHKLVPKIRNWGASLVTLHGRSREGRYTSTADWDYINMCAEAASPMPLIGNGDILSYEDVKLRTESTGVSGIMVARGGLIKPWIFTEVKEQRHWDISSTERFDMLKNFVNYGLEHWGSDNKGVENTRRFLLEWLSFLHRYIPVGVLEVLPQRINERPPSYIGRNDLESLMSSRNCADWVKISEMLLGPVPDTFNFIPKHKANSYS